MCKFKHLYFFCTNFSSACAHKVEQQIILLIGIIYPYNMTKCALSSNTTGVGGAQRLQL